MKLSLANLPQLPFEEFRSLLMRSVLQENCRISAFLSLDADNAQHSLLAVLLSPSTHQLICYSTLVGDTYPSLTPDIPALHWFERELHEESGILPQGHPWLKPIRFTAPDTQPAVTDYFTMGGDAVHEVAVGPVHAGVIEPGHFRFQCMGEDVYSLEIELGYQHRGVEQLLSQGPDARTPHVIETAAGDTSIAAAINYCSILEELRGTVIPDRAIALRGLALELERIANHIGDLGALAGDVAFLPTSSFCGRIRGDFLNMTAKLCGNRFGRGYIIPGGVRFDLTDTDVTDLQARIAKGEQELNEALSLMFDDPSVQDRFENTGTVSTETARQIGLVGVAARASGLPMDSRADLVPGSMKPVTAAHGDVLSRAEVRRQELAASLSEIKLLLSILPKGPFQVPCEGALPGDTMGIHITEAWRGELCHLILTDANGRFRRVKIVDPSFHNWFGLALALRNQQISDFPICNKSFNLSYCGHDL